MGVGAEGFINGPVEIQQTTIHFLHLNIQQVYRLIELSTDENLNIDSSQVRNSTTLGDGLPASIQRMV